MITGGESGALNSLLEDLNELFYTYDDRGIITYVNKKLVEVLGYKVEEVLGKPVWELMPRRFRNTVSKEVGKRLREGYKGIYTVKLLHKDGSERLVREKASPIIKNGCITGEMVLCEDITEQSRTEKLLREKNESLLRTRDELTAANQQLAAVEEEIRQQLEEAEKNQQVLADAWQELESVFNFSPDPMFMINTEGKVIKWNQAMEEMTGIRAQEILGRGDYEYAIPIYGCRRPLLIDLVLNPEAYQEEDFLYVRSDNQALFGESFCSKMAGDGRYLAGKSSKIFDHQGNLIGVIESFRDITERKRAEEALRQSEEKYRNIIESIEDGYFEVDYAGNFTFINPALCRMLDYSEKELLGENYKKIMDEENALRVFRIFNQVYTSGQARRNFGYHIHGKKGISFFVEGAVLPIMSEGKVRGFRGLIRDMSERKRAEEALRLSEARYRAVVEDQTEMIMRLTADFTISFVNEAYNRYFERNYANTIGANLLNLLPREYRREVVRTRELLSFENPVTVLEGWIRDARGEIRWQEWTARAIFNEAGELIEYQAVGRDITERKNAEVKLKFLSLHDTLTGLYNRNYFEEQMRVLEDGRCDPVAMIICDVDGLKMVNDSLGHAEGDRLLKTVATVLTRCFRKSDILARVGGDEFAVLLPETSAEAVGRALGRVRDAISRFNEENEDTLLSISLGYVIREDKKISMNELFKEADNNMYREKVYSRQSIRSSILQTLSKTLESRDYITAGHGERMEKLAIRISQLLDFDEQAIKNMRLLANFHDIGKVGVPDEILHKPESLTAEERSIMQRHCEIGHRIALSTTELSEIADFILKHHEWWDGGGYPLGLRGGEIPLQCRILSIADAFDAMTHKRPYRKTRSTREAVEELKRCSGSQFDPELVDKFIEILHDTPEKEND